MSGAGAQRFEVTDGRPCISCCTSRLGGLYMNLARSDVLKARPSKAEILTCLSLIVWRETIQLDEIWPAFNANTRHLFQRGSMPNEVQKISLTSQVVYQITLIAVQPCMYVWPIQTRFFQRAAACKPCPLSSCSRARTIPSDTSPHSANGPSVGRYDRHDPPPEKQDGTRRKRAAGAQPPRKVRKSRSRSTLRVRTRLSRAAGGQNELWCTARGLRQ